jgi:hypothetical protein
VAVWYIRGERQGGVLGMTFFIDVFCRVAPNLGFTLPSQDDLNATYVPIRDCIFDYKDATQLSFAVIVPAAQIASVNLFIQSYGVATTRKLFERLVVIRRNVSRLL